MSETRRILFVEFDAVVEGVRDGEGDHVTRLQAIELLKGVRKLARAEDFLAAAREVLKVHEEDQGLEERTQVWSVRTNELTILFNSEADAEVARSAQMALLALTPESRDAKFFPRYVYAWLTLSARALGLPFPTGVEIAKAYSAEAIDKDGQFSKIVATMADARRSEFKVMLWDGSLTDSQRLTDALDGMAGTRPSLARMAEALIRICAEANPDAMRTANRVWRQASAALKGWSGQDGLAAEDFAWLLRLPATLAAIGLFTARARSMDVAAKSVADEMEAGTSLVAYLTSHRRAYRESHRGADPSPDHVWPKLAKQIRGVLDRRGVLAERFEAWCASRPTGGLSEQVAAARAVFRRHPAEARMSYLLSRVAIGDFYDFLFFNEAYVRAEISRAAEAAAPAAVATPATKQKPAVPFCEVCKKKGHTAAKCRKAPGREAKQRFLAATAMIAPHDPTVSAAAAAAPSTEATNQALLALRELLTSSETRDFFG